MLDEIDTKKPWESLGIWGGMVGLLGSGLGAFTTMSLAPEDAAQLPGLVVSAITAVGGILAILGRIRASRRIGK